MEFKNWLIQQELNEAKVKKKKVRKLLPTEMPSPPGIEEHEWQLWKQHIEKMGKNKQWHSQYVAKCVAELGMATSTIVAAYFHDYPERIGQIDPVKQQIGMPQQSVNLINYMTDLEDGKVVSHVKQVLSSEEMQNNPEMKNSYIIIKICDRISNLHKRVATKTLGKKYIKKSVKLFKILMSSYSGPANLNKLADEIRKIDKRITISPLPSSSPANQMNQGPDTHSL